MLRLLTFFVLVLLSACSSPPSYDIAIMNGRLLDPESGLDAVRNIGIQGGSIATITEDEIEGKQTLNAGGHVVTAGFIDLHRHGHRPENYPVRANHSSSDWNRDALQFPSQKWPSCRPVVI